MQPNETFWKVFAGIGIAFVVVIFVALAYAAFDALRGVVRDLRWKYKYEHRFDKPPTAKCYWLDVWSEYCWLFGFRNVVVHYERQYSLKKISSHLSILP